MSGPGIIAEEPPQMCEHCGQIEECRPYGAQGEQICFDCSQKLDPKIIEQRMRAYIFGSN